MSEVVNPPCPECGYDGPMKTAEQGTVCPECGADL